MMDVDKIFYKVEDKKKRKQVSREDNGQNNKKKGKDEKIPKCFDRLYRNQKLPNTPPNIDDSKMH